MFESVILRGLDSIELFVFGRGYVRENNFSDITKFELGKLCGELFVFEVMLGVRLKMEYFRVLMALSYETLSDAVTKATIRITDKFGPSKDVYSEFNEKLGLKARSFKTPGTVQSNGGPGALLVVRLRSKRKTNVTGTGPRWSDDRSTCLPSAIRVDVAGENDHVGSPVGFVTTSEEEGAEEASYAQRGPLFPVLRGVLAEDGAEDPRDRVDAQFPADRQRSEELHRPCLAEQRLER
ncbi:hypothetical protein WN48_10873 [Eufriesea mexicana]|uniref:Uncharacterized protein n=1 Tax=Eufriesea mexicana TaxID=516756 RepID=A0A310SKZ3_9HYME|nr:hypothetical protein WN48_10873 [Eufriesea mexicana]